MEGTSSRLFCERGAFFNSKCATRLYKFLIFFSDSVNFFKKIKKLTPTPAPAPAPTPTPTPTPSRRFTDTQQSLGYAKKNQTARCRFLATLIVESGLHPSPTIGW